MGRQGLIWLGVICSVFATMLLGLPMAFNVYSINLKTTFNLTQTDVEIVSSAVMMGEAFTICEPLISERFGFKAGYGFIWILATVSALLMWMAAVYNEFFSEFSGFLAVTVFLMSLAQVCGSTKMAAITLVNVPKKHTGKVVGLYSACLASSKLFYGLVFLYVFKENMQDFFLALSLSFAGSIAICFFLHKPIDETSINMSEEQEMIPLDVSTPETKSTPDESRFTDLIASRDFHMIFWPSGIHYAVMYSFMNSLLFISWSVGVDVPMYLVYVLSITIVIGRITFGILFDRFGSSRSGFGILLCGSFASVCACLLVIFVLNKTTIYVIAVLYGWGISCGITIPASLLSVRFGHSHFSFILNSYYCVLAVFCVIFQLFIGFIYDGQMELDRFCYGPACFKLPFVVFLWLSLSCFILQVISSFLHTSVL